MKILADPEGYLRPHNHSMYQGEQRRRPQEIHLMKPIPDNRMNNTSPLYTDEHAAAGLDVAMPEIETWQNHFRSYEILIDDPEFTSVCPRTGLPDFGHLTIRYMPKDRCLELKSLKEYLFCYRNLGIFQENICNRVLDDMVKACEPVWAEVKGDFRPRGGISTVVTATFPRPHDQTTPTR